MNFGIQILYSFENWHYIKRKSFNNSLETNYQFELLPPSYQYTKDVYYARHEMSYPQSYTGWCGTPPN